MTKKVKQNRKENADVTGKIMKKNANRSEGSSGGLGTSTAAEETRSYHNNTDGEQECV